MKIKYEQATIVDEAIETFTPNSWFIVEDGKISEIGTQGTTSKITPEQTISLKNRYVVPGMINCHTHMTLDPSQPTMVEKQLTESYLTTVAFKNLKEMLHAGVTYFRDLGAPADLDLHIKTLIDEPAFLAPECVVSGTPLVMTGGHAYPMGLESDGVAEITKHTRMLLKKGVGCIKLMATGGVMTAGETPHDEQLSLEEMHAAVVEAKHKGKKVAAHAQGLKGIKNALNAGVDSIEHGVFLDAEAVELLVAKEAYLSPTLVAPYFIIEYGKDYGIPQYMIDKSKKMIDSHMQSLAMAIKAGVKIVLGTDAGTPFNRFGSSWKELELMCQCGLSYQGALKAATITGAQLLGIADDYGTLSVGKTADFVVFEKNPFDDVLVLKTPQSVYKKGTLVTETFL